MNEYFNNLTEEEQQIYLDGDFDDKSYKHEDGS